MALRIRSADPHRIPTAYLPQPRPYSAQTPSTARRHSRKYSRAIQSLFTGVAPDVLRMRLRQAAEFHNISLVSFLHQKQEGIIAAFSRLKGLLGLIYPPNDETPDLERWSVQLLCKVLCATECLALQELDDVKTLEQSFRRHFRMRPQSSASHVGSANTKPRREWIGVCSAIQRLVENTGDPEMIKSVRNFICKVEMEPRMPRVDKEMKHRLIQTLTELIESNPNSKYRVDSRNGKIIMKQQAELERLRKSYDDIHSRPSTRSCTVEKSSGLMRPRLVSTCLKSPYENPMNTPYINRIDSKKNAWDKRLYVEKQTLVKSKTKRQLPVLEKVASLRQRHRSMSPRDHFTLDRLLGSQGHRSVSPRNRLTLDRLLGKSRPSTAPDIPRKRTNVHNGSTRPRPVSSLSHPGQAAQGRRSATLRDLVIAKTTLKLGHNKQKEFIKTSQKQETENSLAKGEMRRPKSGYAQKLHKNTGKKLFKERVRGHTEYRNTKEIQKGYAKHASMKASERKTEGKYIYTIGFVNDNIQKANSKPVRRSRRHTTWSSKERRRRQENQAVDTTRAVSAPPRDAQVTRRVRTTAAIDIHETTQRMKSSKAKIHDAERLGLATTDDLHNVKEAKSTTENNIGEKEQVRSVKKFNKTKEKAGSAIGTDVKITKRSGTASHIVDSATKAVRSATHGVDSATKAVGSTTHRIDSATKAVRSATHGVDSATKAVGSTTHRVDSATKSRGSATQQMLSTKQRVGSATWRVGSAKQQMGSATKHSGLATQRAGSATKHAGLATQRAGSATKYVGLATQREGSATKLVTRLEESEVQRTGSAKQRLGPATKPVRSLTPRMGSAKEKGMSNAKQKGDERVSAEDAAKCERAPTSPLQMLVQAKASVKVMAQTQLQADNGANTQTSSDKHTDVASEMKKVAMEVLVHQNVHSVVHHDIFNDRDSIDAFFDFLYTHQILKQFLRSPNSEPLKHWTDINGKPENFYFLHCFTFRQLEAGRDEAAIYVVEKVLTRLQCQHLQTPRPATSAASLFDGRKSLLQEAIEYGRSRTMPPLQSKNTQRKTAPPKRSQTPLPSSSNTNKDEQGQKLASQQSLARSSTCWKCKQKDLAMTVSVNWGNTSICQLLHKEGVNHKAEHLLPAVKVNSLTILQGVVRDLRAGRAWVPEGDAAKEALYEARKQRLGSLAEYLEREGVADDRQAVHNVCVTCLF